MTAANTSPPKIRVGVSFIFLFFPVSNRFPPGTLPSLRHLIPQRLEEGQDFVIEYGLESRIATQIDC